MTDQKIIKLLGRTGHLGFPFGEHQDVPQKEIDQLLLNHPAVQRAIASYQDFMVVELDNLSLDHHSRPLHCDGEIGPATLEMMERPRCGCPDYGHQVGAAVGTGSWPRCHDVGEFHAATVYIHEGGMASFLEPVFDKVWAQNVAAYDEIGLRWIRSDDRSANINFSFVSRSNGWIGLAIVGERESCTSQIWCKYLASYRPSNVVREWATLIMHELGHNAGLYHSRGGIMNPSIINGLPASWNNDPSLSILARYYGGEPIPDGPEGDEYWIKQCFESNRGRTVCVPLVPPILVEEDTP